jgi:hypothetical protein
MTLSVIFQRLIIRIGDLNLRENIALKISDEMKSIDLFETIKI